MRLKCVGLQKSLCIDYIFPTNQEDFLTPKIIQYVHYPLGTNNCEFRVNSEDLFSKGVTPSCTILNQNEEFLPHSDIRQEIEQEISLQYSPYGSVELFEVPMRLKRDWLSGDNTTTQSFPIEFPNTAKINEGPDISTISEEEEPKNGITTVSQIEKSWHIRSKVLPKVLNYVCHAIPPKDDQPCFSENSILFVKGNKSQCAPNYTEICNMELPEASKYNIKGLGDLITSFGAFTVTPNKRTLSFGNNGSILFWKNQQTFGKRYIDNILVPTCVSRGEISFRSFMEKLIHSRPFPLTNLELEIRFQGLKEPFAMMKTDTKSLTKSYCTQQETFEEEQESPYYSNLLEQKIREKFRKLQAEDNKYREEYSLMIDTTDVQLKGSILKFFAMVASMAPKEEFNDIFSRQK